MTSRDFCFWLQGFFEVGNFKQVDYAQTELIRNHLNLVFKHEIDPSMGSPAHQAELNKIHDHKTHGPGFIPDKPLMRC